MKKLDHKWTGPYTILEKIGNMAYRLELTGDLQRIHNVFHVDRLKEHHRDPYKRTKSPPPPVFIKGEPEYEIESIQDSRPGKGEEGNIEYLVKWVGYDESSWIPWQSMVGSLDTVQEWHRVRPRKRRLGKEQFRELQKLALEDEEEQRNFNKERNSRETTLARATRVLKGGKSRQELL